MIGRNDECWCGSGKKWKKCHYPATPPNADAEIHLKREYLKKHHILIKDEEQIAGIRAACILASSILDKTAALAKAGITTNELNAFAHQLHLEANAIPAALNYGEPPFPKSVPISLNEVICHGIADDVPLKEGDILNIDVASILNGYYGDCSKMVVIGQTTHERQLVVDVAYEALMNSIEILKPGIPVYAIGDAIEACAVAKGCSVVNQFVGHGVGVKFHEGPQIEHHRNRNGILLVPGMTFTIEPMINAGTRKGIIDETDGWTARTADGKASAQFEHTILITPTGHEVLTNWQR